MKFRQIFPGGVYLPENVLSDLSAQLRNDLFFQNTVVVLGSAELLGRRARWNEVATILKQYRLFELLDVLGRISTVLSNDQGHETSIQRYLCSVIFQEKSGEVWQRLEQHKSANSRKALFETTQILTCIRAAIKFCPIGEVGHFYNLRLEKLGIALLEINDLHSERLHPADATPVQVRHALSTFLLANGIFNSSDNLLHQMVRTYDLYFERSNSLKSEPEYIDLPKVFEELVGVEKELYMGIIFGFHTNYMKYRMEEIKHKVSSISESSYFRANYGFTDAENRRIMSFVSEDVSNLKNKLQYADVENQYDILLLRKKPMINHGGVVYCSSSKLLFEKMTKGIHHHFLDDCERTSAQRNGFQKFMGTVFSSYVREVLARAIDGPERIFDLDEIYNRSEALRKSGKRADILIDYGFAVIVIEIKSKTFSYNVQTGSEFLDYTSTLDDLYVKSAKQISATINTIKSGALVGEGFKPDVIKKYYPLTVTLESTIQNPLFIADLERMVCNIDIGKKNVESMQIMDVSELETLEHGLRKGACFLEIMKEKLGREDYRKASFRNYFLQKKEPYWFENNSHLEGMYEKIMKEVLQAMEERKSAT